MTRLRTLRRRLLLDLTPLMDVTMILLFGVMINSVKLIQERAAAAPSANQSTPSQNDADLAELQKALRNAELGAEQARSERDQVRRRLEAQHEATVAAMARVLGLTPEAREKLAKRLADLAAASPEAAEAAADALDHDVTSAQILRALRRIQEMQKVFTFVDLHVDASDFLSVDVDGKRSARFSARDREISAVATDIDNSLESERFSDIVLFLYSYDGDARDRTVEVVESSIDRVLTDLRRSESTGRHQFRYGLVGLVSLPSENKEN